MNLNASGKANVITVEKATPQIQVHKKVALSNAPLVTGC